MQIFMQQSKTLLSVTQKTANWSDATTGTAL